MNTTVKHIFILILLLSSIATRTYSKRRVYNINSNYINIKLCNGKEIYGKLTSNNFSLHNKIEYQSLKNGKIKKINRQKIDKVIFSNGKIEVFNETINLLDGRIMFGNNINIINDSLLSRLYFNKKNRTRSISLYKVFSVIDKKGNENLIYQQDSMTENYFTVDEARLYLLGAQDARKHYHSLSSNAFSLIVAAVGINYGFYGTVAPAIYVGLSSISMPKISLNKGAQKKYINNEFYREGFLDAAKKKRVLSDLRTGYITFFGGVIGIPYFY